MSCHITVMIPTYKRLADLERCLHAIEQQTRQPDSIVVIITNDDTVTQDFLSSGCHGLDLSVVVTAATGQVCALNSGLSTATGDIVAITDDDAAPWPDWLERIENWFAKTPDLSGIGGRDWVYHGDCLDSGVQDQVGKLLWYGHFIGNHHLGAGAPRDVDFLKGVNCAYRTTVIKTIRFDERLRGRRAQAHNDFALGLKIVESGGRIIYDPQIAVNHYPSTRWEVVQRGEFEWQSHVDMVHNETLALLESTRINRVIFMIWSLLIGSRRAYGITQMIRFIPSSGVLAVKQLAASFYGRALGIRTWLECLERQKIQ